MKKIYLNDYFMTEFLFNKFGEKSPEYTVKRVRDCFGKQDSPFLIKLFKTRFLPYIYLFLFYLHREFNKLYLNDRDKCTDVLYFAVEGMYDLSRLLFINKNKNRHVLWIWNPVSSIGKNKYDRFIYLHLFIPLLKFVGVELWTFDKNDACNYQFTYHPQVHNMANIVESISENKTAFISKTASDFLFVGKDKGRINKLLQLNDVLLRFDVDCFLHIVRDSDKIYSDTELNLTKSVALPYNEYLTMISESAGLIDLVQNGQSGLTLRVLEALFLKKKLITNNSSLKDYDFFNASNIYILDDNLDYDALADFLSTDFKCIDENILIGHDLSHLLKDIFR